MDCAMLLAFNVFQSTPPREGRPSSGATRVSIQRFNPRPRVRGDAAIQALAQRYIVSIHAPA